jgi:3',5'-cyclic AMP phosphodiesterase CpdA
MRTLVHLSDPHFGRLERATVQALIATVTEARPDVVVVSGDLTQRAKEREFQEARQFLDAFKWIAHPLPSNASLGIASTTLSSPP